MKKTIALILAAVLLALPLWACSDDKDNSTDNATYGPDDKVIASESFSYTRAEFSIAFNQYYQEFFSDYETIDFYNLDTEASLKDQIYYDDVTWFDFFADMAIDYMKEILILCEAAKEAGVELSEDDLKNIEDAVDVYVRYAADYGYSEDEYFALRFGPDADQDALREYFKKEALAFMYQDSLLKEYSFSAEEVRDYAEKNWKDFYTVSYLSYTFDEDKDPQAKASADALSKITDAKDFEDYIASYMTDTLNIVEELVDTDDCHNDYKYYDEYSEFSKWVFENKADAEGKTYVKSNDVDGQYTVYLVTKAPALRSEATKTIRAIYLLVSEHETTAKTLEHAETLLDQWKAGDATEESFIELINKESDDDVSRAVDGLVEGIAAGDPLPEGLSEWLYRDDIAKGDTAIFKDTETYYVVYYCSDGEIKWEMDARDGLTSEKYTAEKDGLFEKYPLEQFDKVINSLDM